MSSSRDRLWGAACVFFAGLALLPYLGGPTAHAQQAGAGPIFAVTAPGQGQGNNVLFVIDSISSRLMVYEHRVGGELSLRAVRNMEHELQFEEWPAPPKKKGASSKAQRPSVKEIRDQLKAK